MEKFFKVVVHHNDPHMIWKPREHLSFTMGWDRAFYTVETLPPDAVLAYGDWDNRDWDMKNFSTYYPTTTFTLTEWFSKTPEDISEVIYKNGMIA